MTEPSAIKCTYADFRNIRTRQVCQLIFEIPAERSEEALRFLGGVPIAGTEKWFAVARLQVGEKSPEKQKPEKRKWDELPPATQAGIRCGEKAFTKFVIERGYAPDDIDKALANDEDVARAGILQCCGVSSRSDLSKDARATKAWSDMDSDYQMWLYAPEVP